MLKTTLFDCAINEKCCSVDGGWGNSLFFVPTPGLFASYGVHLRTKIIENEI